MTYPHEERDQNDNRRPGQEGDGPLMPEGDYPVVAIGYRWGFSSNGGEQIGIRLRVIEGPHAGKSLLYYGSLNGGAREFTLKAIKTLGILDLVFSAPNGPVDNSAQAIAVVGHEEYNGKITAKVNWINGVDIVMKEEMNDQDFRAFAARMKGEIARMGGNTRPSAPPPREPARPPAQQEMRRPAPEREQSRGYDPARDARNAAPPPDDQDAPPWGRRQ